MLFFYPENNKKKTMQAVGGVIKGITTGTGSLGFNFWAGPQPGVREVTPPPSPLKKILPPTPPSPKENQLFLRSRYWCSLCSSLGKIDKYLLNTC